MTGFNHADTVHKSEIAIKSDQANDADPECGAILLTTLLIMTIMAILAVAIFDDIRLSVKRSVHIQQAGQSLWYQKGAQEYADLYIENLMQNQNELAVNNIIRKSTPLSFPIEGGNIVLDITDASNCFALGSLITDKGAGNGGAQEIMIRLLKNIGKKVRNEVQNNGDKYNGIKPVAITDNTARTLAAQSVDWADINSTAEQNGAEDLQYLNARPAYRTANRAFSSVMELRALAAMNEAVYQTIRPYFCAVQIGETVAANINSAQAGDLPYLTALLSASVSNRQNADNATGSSGRGKEDTEIEAALLTILEQRPAAGYASHADLWSQSALQELDLGENLEQLIGVSITMLRVHARINLGQSKRSVISYYLLDYDRKTARLVMRSANPEQNWAKIQKEAL